MVANKNIKWIATGRRKSSVARVSFTRGKGKFLVNGRDFNEYFNRDTQKMIIRQPLNLLELDGQYDISVNVNGGGSTGQAGAVRLGISRALEKINGDYRSELKSNGMLTRDSRKVERKKYGQPGARKKFQFSKR
tara:strand:+ start:3998 stop:4399 length:402 start_codon:yes stop_codon:yes gene_type:complete